MQTASFSTIDFVIQIPEARSAGPGRSDHAARLGDDVKRYGVVDAAGREVGYVIGWLYAGAPAEDGRQVPAPARGQAYQDWARDFVGRFICYLEEDRGGAFYLDATGSLGLVYDPRSRTLASTPDLLPGAADRRGDPQLGTMVGNAHYGFGETSISGVLRLMPNFALDTRDFTARRFWPTETPAAVPGSNDRDAALIANIFANVRRNVERVIARGNAALHLTAGLDSRMVLAAAWASRRRVPFFTFATGSARPTADSEIAAQIARTYALDHVTLRTATLEPGRIAEACGRTGYCVSDQAFQVSGISALIEGKWRFVSGLAGEVGRCFYWGAGDLGGGRPSADDLVARTRVIVGPGTMHAAKAWLNTLPELPAAMIWDLAYLEQRLAHWAGAMTSGISGRMPAVSAFNSFAVIRGKLALSPQCRLSGAYPRDFIRLAEPDLLRIPVNRRPGLRQLLEPRAVAKRILPRATIRRVQGLRLRMGLW